MKVKTKSKFVPTLGMAFNVLMCAIFRVEMDFCIEANEIRIKSTKESAK